METKFLKKVQGLVIANLSDPNFGVEELAMAISMHRSSLTRKLSELNGQSPSDMIEDMRMQKAWDMITSSDMPISQITFEVGFTELSNFSRAFKRYFGDSPSNIRNGSFEMKSGDGDATN